MRVMGQKKQALQVRVDAPAPARISRRQAVARAHTKRGREKGGEKEICIAAAFKPSSSSSLIVVVVIIILRAHP